MRAVNDSDAAILGTREVCARTPSHRVAALGVAVVLSMTIISPSHSADDPADKSPNAKAPGAAARFVLGKDGDAIRMATAEGAPFYEFQMRPPEKSPLSVKSGGFFHPVYTPKGARLTDLAPADHPHHRGVFLAFVEMRGAKHDGDFWGWGEHAPKDGRVIEGVGMRRDEKNGAAVAFENAWKASGEIMLDEKLLATASRHADANVLDLAYELTPREDLRMPRWAFSGFCVRLRKDGKIAYTSPSGAVKLPPLDHMKPELDWPAADWYDATVTLADGSAVGVAVVDHPSNPPCLWHNEERIHMVNPCIVAPGEVKLTAGKPLRLSYRLIIHDGPPPIDAIKKLAAEFRAKK